MSRLHARARSNRVARGQSAARCLRVSRLRLSCNASDALRSFLLTDAAVPLLASQMGSVGLIVVVLTIVVAVSTMTQGGGEGDVPRFPKRRADALGPAAVAYLPAGGIRLDPRAVPVLSFTGAPTGDDTKLDGTDAAVAQLGGKTDAARLVAIVEAELARQDGDGGGGGGGGGGDSGADAQGKKSKPGRQPYRLTQVLSAAADTVSHSQMQQLGSREDIIKNLRRVVEELTCYDGVLRYRQHWPWVNDGAKMPRLSVGAQEEVERLRAVLAYCDDGNMWRCQRAC